jgi:hypothetical protein
MNCRAVSDRGWPIGSGMVESGCRVRQCRCKRPRHSFGRDPRGLRHLDAPEEACDNGHWDELWLTALMVVVPSCAPQPGILCFDLDEKLTRNYGLILNELKFRLDLICNCNLKRIYASPFSAHNHCPLSQTTSFICNPILSSASFSIGSAALSGPKFMTPENVARISGRPDEVLRRKMLKL